MPALVASDLDRTLIYSAAALALTMPDARAPRLLCVEVHESKPLSYMTETAAQLLTDLGDAAVFVPTTTRTRKQYLRINLPGPAPTYAICANGGHILVDGGSDPDWHAQVTARLADQCAPLAEVQEHLLRAADPVWVRKHRVADDLFAYLVVERELLNEDWVKELAVWAENRGWTVSLQGRKIYAVPKPLTKSAAMRRGRLPARRRPAPRGRPGLAPGPRGAGRHRLDGSRDQGASRAGRACGGADPAGVSADGSGCRLRARGVR
jgi:hypothetical protein